MCDVANYRFTKLDVPNEADRAAFESHINKLKSVFYISSAILGSAVLVGFPVYANDVIFSNGSNWLLVDGLNATRQDLTPDDKKILMDQLLIEQPKKV